MILYFCTENLGSFVEPRAFGSNVPVCAAGIRLSPALPFNVCKVRSVYHLFCAKAAWGGCRQKRRHAPCEIKYKAARRGNIPAARRFYQILAPRRRKAHMRAVALRQPLRFLRLLFSRGSARARSGNSAHNAPFPSSKAVKATPWLCQESAFSPFSQKIFCFAKSFSGAQDKREPACRPMEHRRQD